MAYNTKRRVSSDTQREKQLTRKTSPSRYRTSVSNSSSRVSTKSSYQRNYRRSNHGRRKRNTSGRDRIAAVLILFFFIFFAGRAIYNKFFKLPYSYDVYITKYSEKYSVSKELVASVIYNESRFNKDAKSNQDAHGLMQIQPETANFIAGKLNMDYENGDLYDPEINIKMGTWYLSYLLKRFNGNLRHAIAAYNAGPNAVQSWLEDDRYSQNGELISIPYKETANYVDNVLRMKTEYENKFKKITGENK